MKFRISSACVLAVAETWTLTQQMCIGQASNISKCAVSARYRPSNKQLRATSGLYEPFYSLVEESSWLSSWPGSTVRFQHHVFLPASVATSEIGTSHNSWCRPPGRPRITWLRLVQSDIGISLTETWTQTRAMMIRGQSLR